MTMVIRVATLLSEILLPDAARALGDCTNRLVTLSKKPPTISPQHHPLSQPTQRAKRRSETQFIAHESLAFLRSFKKVLVLEAAKHSLDHHIAKVAWPLIAIDQRRVPQHEPEVPSSPCDGFIRTNETVSDSRDGLLTCRLRTRHVQIDAQRQKKAALRRRRNPCFKLDDLHYNSIACSTTSFFARVKNSSTVCDP